MHASVAVVSSPSPPMAVPPLLCASATCLPRVASPRLSRLVAASTAQSVDVRLLDALFSFHNTLQLPHTHYGPPDRRNLCVGCPVSRWQLADAKYVADTTQEVGE